METKELYVDPEDVDPDPEQDDIYDPDAKRERFGNNRYHIPKSVAKAKRKSAKIARRKNRK